MKKKEKEKRKKKKDTARSLSLWVNREGNGSHKCRLFMFSLKH